VSKGCRSPDSAGDFTAKPIANYCRLWRETKKLNKNKSLLWRPGECRVPATVLARTPTISICFYLYFFAGTMPAISSGIRHDHATGNETSVKKITTTRLQTGAVTGHQTGKHP
jgi:hypothetical protein